MSNLKIDYDTLLEELTKLKEIKEKLLVVLNDLKNETNGLKDCWESKTSEVVFTNFEEFYKGFDGCVNNIQKDISFLEETLRLYKEYESKANDVIDEKIAL